MWTLYILFQIDPKPATNKQAQSGGGAGAGAGPQSGVPTDKVFVGGLSLHTTEDGLTKFFSDLVGYEHVTFNLSVLHICWLSLQKIQFL